MENYNPLSLGAGIRLPNFKRTQTRINSTKFYRKFDIVEVKQLCPRKTVIQKGFLNTTNTTFQKIIIPRQNGQILETIAARHRCR